VRSVDEAAAGLDFDDSRFRQHGMDLVFSPAAPGGAAGPRVFLFVSNFRIDDGQSPTRSVRRTHATPHPYQSDTAACLNLPWPARRLQGENTKKRQYFASLSEPARRIRAGILSQHETRSLSRPGQLTPDRHRRPPKHAAPVCAADSRPRRGFHAARRGVICWFAAAPSQRALAHRRLVQTLECPTGLPCLEHHRE
jgi:hypothetical protein